jgi:hypothetical protein
MLLPYGPYATLLTTTQITRYVLTRANVLGDCGSGWAILQEEAMLRSPALQCLGDCGYVLWTHSTATTNDGRSRLHPFNRVPSRRLRGDYAVLIVFGWRLHPGHMSF